MINLVADKQLNRRKLFNIIFGNQELLDTIFTNFPLGIALFNNRGNVVDANDKFLKLFRINTMIDIAKLNLFEELNITTDEREFINSNTAVELNKTLDLDDLHKKLTIPVKRSKESVLYLKCVIIPIINKLNNQGSFYLTQIQDLTQEREIAVKLKDSEIRFRMIVENSREGIFIVDDNYKMIYANDELSNILEFSVEEIVGRDFRTFLDEESMDLVVDRYKRRQLGQKVAPRYEFNVVRKDGTKRRVAITSTATKELRGGTKTIAQIIDITKQKKIEQNLKETEEIFRELGEQKLISILIVQNNEIKYANETLGTSLGYSKQEMESWTFNDYLELLYPDDKVFVIQQLKIKNRTEEEKEKNYEFRVIKKDGKIAWREVFSKEIVYNGKPAELISIIDIDEKKRSEIRIQEEEAKFKRVFEAIPDLFFLVDNNSKILDYKGELEDLYLPPSQFLEKELKNLLPEGLGKKSDAAIKRVLETKNPELLEYEISIRNELRYYEARLLYYYKDKVAIFIRDITNRKKAEDMIKEEVKKLKEIDQIRKDLISRVSHELKTPIMAISGASEYLLEKYGNTLNNEEHELVSMIINNEKRLEQLIGDLLDISRFDYNRIKLEKRQYNINKVIRLVSKEMEYLHKRRGIVLETNLSEEIILNIDRVRIEQVFINLISNAIKNTPPGGKILIKSFKTIDKLQIEIADTGVGLTSNEISKIFTKFGKIERYGDGLEFLDISGSGLGLYISKKIIQMHDGKIWVESEGRHKGSKFLINLPID
ncbi:MAG: PAS domain S-box protein [Candidatus Lokiarchaeota archaeon]|nr:PAS domain S-box protein [Candidatus Lokiarchaeota archaeon]MBD3201677.1 PAS domain S-box protein [Candidatus Lokiarchaeota archaeon]